ncbi:Hsp70 family protein [Pleomorphomonas carboxyditropha]|uniref:Heat-shock protein n=1 Tax=Pleomorphomonas carboxyditropha TaxID=2023338 RepID=A0A2G9WXV8_9HYPH|nr:Hsp70 family protein [Pleomorphomonas carboxyditropha]PIO99504.1 heat-shock protein [Pleomorphomonas carboxyditropha]
MAAAGLDFGTSNTTLGVVSGGRADMVRLEGDEETLPSATFYHQDGSISVGRAAIAAYVGGEHGRLMRALKSVLGSALMEETTLVGRSRVKFRDVLKRYLAEVKKRGEAAAGAPLTHLVHGRPVHFVDGNAEADRLAETTLHAIARDLGFREVSFQYEPIAASLDYEQQLSREELALIADIGGGTSDFSIVRLGPERAKKAERASDVLANDGVRIGGTDFDRHLSLGRVMPLLGFRSKLARGEIDVPSVYYHDLATWSAINRLYESRVHRELVDLEKRAAAPRLIQRLMRVVDDERGHTLAIEVEAAKIAVAEQGAVAVPFDWLERGLSTHIDHAELVRHTGELAGRIGARVDACLAAAGVAASDIDAVFLTGGSTRLEHVRAAILAAVPEARVVTGNVFGSVGTGLAVEAARRYG